MHFPYEIDGRGRTADREGDARIRDLIEQVLFTIPGERPNRPTFGTGLSQLVFAPSSDVLTLAIQVPIQGTLQQWLGHLIEVLDVEIDSDDAHLRVQVSYLVRRDRARHTATFDRSLGT